MNNEEKILFKEIAPNESDLKDIIINYVGKITDPKDDAVTVEHIIDVFAEQFPEFLLALAEENWINGYTQALSDLKYTNKNEKLHQTKKSQAK